MTALEWSKPDERRFESGLDRGVLFLQDGRGVAWNGLIAVDQKTQMKITPLYWDGRHHNDLVIPGDYSARLRAYTYPDEFMEVEGVEQVEKGMFVGNQPPQRFHLCYRTHVGNQEQGQYADYKIHVIYNCLAKPSTKGFDSISDNPDAVEFVWDITAVPQDLDGFTASAHMIFDSRFTEPDLLSDIEDILYGTATVDPNLPSLQGWSSYIRKWARQIIYDNGDGTFTWVIADDTEFTDNGDGTFTVTGANATHDGTDTWTISSTDADEGDI